MRRPGLAQEGEDALEGCGALDAAEESEDALNTAAEGSHAAEEGQSVVEVTDGGEDATEAVDDREQFVPRRRLTSGHSLSDV